MYIAYDNLPDNSRIWIYQANRELTNDEIAYITTNTTDFINQWTRHGEDLKGSFTVKYNYFLVLAVDESFNDVSGCSIDTSVRFIKELEQKLAIDLTDKMNVSFKDGERINIVKLSDFQGFVKKGNINKNTMVFNNMVNTKKDFENNWEVPAKDSWHNRFLK